jgi:bifunctional non-homologous end joining protein LigD
VHGDGRQLYAQVTQQGGEGLIAKRVNSPYRSGKSHSDWRKLKLLLRQEFVVGGWTESDRRPFRALLIGIYTDNGLTYVGRMGKAFSDEELRRLSQMLQMLEQPVSPFVNRADPDAKPHWIRPELVIEAKFTEWTKGGKLREPTYLGLRTDVDPKTVRREAIVPLPDTGPQTTTASREQLERHRRKEPIDGIASHETGDLITQIDRIEREGATGVLTFQDGHSLS